VDKSSTTTLNLASNDSDVDDGLDPASIAIVSGPSNGTVLVNADGTVNYTHDGSATETDTFIYTIDDLAGATSNIVIVDIAINNSVDELLFDEAVIQPLEIDPKEPDAGNDFSETTDNSSPDEPQTEQLFDEVEPIRGGPSLLSVLNDLPPLEDMISATQASLTDDNQIIARPNDQSRNALDNPLTTNDLFWQELNQLRNNLDGSDDDNSLNGRLAEIIMSIGSLSITSGILAWLLRGGTLVASFVSSMPLWKGVDFLPVLAKKKREKEEEEDENTTSADKRIERLIDGDSTHF
jgi:hypothetical protein